MTVTWILLGIWGAVCNVWTGLLVAQRVAKRRGLLDMVSDVAAEGTSDAEAEPWPSVTAIVPARNEADGLDHCIASLLHQDYPSFTLLIVDDRSSDATYDVARRLASRDDRIAVCRINELPEGWMGKSHALAQGSQSARSDWLLFVDADCTLEPDAIRQAITGARQRGVDMLTLWPRHDGRSFWEHMTIPLCGGVIALWFGMKSVLRPTHAPFGNGQFVLIRRDAYQRIGGHEAVRQALIEDIPLAERARDAGVRCAAVCGKQVAAVRMYHDLQSTAAGWARIFAGALRSGWRIWLSVLWLAVGSLLPFVAAPVIAVILARAAVSGTHLSTPLMAAAGICAMHLGLIALVSYRFWALGGCDRRYLWLYPLSVVVVIAILVRSWWWLCVRHHVRWRDTTYRIDRHAQIVGIVTER